MEQKSSSSAFLAKAGEVLGVVGGALCVLVPIVGWVYGLNVRGVREDMQRNLTDQKITDLRTEVRALQQQQRQDHDLLIEVRTYIRNRLGH